MPSSKHEGLRLLFAETEADGTWNKVSSVSTKIDPVLLFVEFDQATSILCQLFFFMISELPASTSSKFYVMLPLPV